jgi:hypothetical protein
MMKAGIDVNERETVIAYFFSDIPNNGKTKFERIKFKQKF